VITLREVAAGMVGAYRLARFDANGAYFFDGSKRSFWNSFWVALIVAPFFTLMIAIDFVEETESIDLLRFTLVQAIGYVIGWVLFPLVMVPLSRFIGKDSRYTRFITAYNWCAVLQSGIYMPLAVLAAGTAGASTEAVSPGTFLSFVAMGYVLVYSWFVARAALEATAVEAVFIVMVDFTLGIFINAVVTSLTGHPLL
jgi:hypothetical protein